MMLYLETNFILGAAKGQDERASELLDIPEARLRIALPDLCLMEAWVAFEKEQAEGKTFERAVHSRIEQTKRDTVSMHSKKLVTSLKRAARDYRDGLNQAEQRFRATLEKVSVRVELIPVTRTALERSLLTPEMARPRDNLILATILDHAQNHPDEAHALLTDDREFRAPALNAGLQYFARTEAFLGWFNSQNLTAPA